LIFARAKPSARRREGPSFDWLALACAAGKIHASTRGFASASNFASSLSGLEAWLVGVESRYLSAA
jgi:hypothetical protein